MPRCVPFRLRCRSTKPPSTPTVQNPPAGVSTWPGESGGYSAVMVAVAPLLNWVTIQFYNQGPTCYTNFTTLFQDANAGGACTQFPGTSLFEIVSYGVPAELVVVGKITETFDGGNGYVAPPTLHTYFLAANASLGWYVGVAAYSWDAVDSAGWIAGVFPPLRVE